VSIETAAGPVSVRRRPAVFRGGEPSSQGHGSRQGLRIWTQAEICLVVLRSDV